MVVISVAALPAFGLGDADRGLVAGQDGLGGQAPLRVRAVRQDRAQRAHVGLHHDAGGGGAGLGDLGDDAHRLQRRAPLPAQLARDGHAQQAGLAQRADVVPGIGLGAVDLRRARRQDLLGQPAGAGDRIAGALRGPIRVGRDVVDDAHACLSPVSSRGAARPGDRRPKPE